MVRGKGHVAEWMLMWQTGCGRRGDVAVRICLTAGKHRRCCD